MARRHQSVQEMVVDYSIALAILGLFYSFLTPVLTASVAILFKMVWDIARAWNFTLTLQPIAILAEILHILGACAIALLAWTTLVFVSVFVPVADRFALSAALMSGCWTLGASVNQYFLNGVFRRELRQAQACGSRRG